MTIWIVVSTVPYETSEQFEAAFLSHEGAEKYMKREIKRAVLADIEYNIIEVKPRK